MNLPAYCGLASHEEGRIYRLLCCEPVRRHYVRAVLFYLSIISSLELYSLSLYVLCSLSFSLSDYSDQSDSECCLSFLKLDSYCKFVLL